jgi:predicted amidophosphoribosyltransferase
MKRICQTCKKEYDGEPNGSYGYPYKCDECKKEFDLSKKIIISNKYIDNFLYEEDVKEFIKRLKEENDKDIQLLVQEQINKSLTQLQICDRLNEIINKSRIRLDQLAGDKLI